MLVQKRKEALQKAKALVDGAKLGGRDLTQEERDQVEAYSNEAFTLGNQIAEEQGAALDALKARTDEMELRLNTPTFSGADVEAGAGKCLDWSTSDGHECKALYGNVRLAKTNEPNPVGKTIQGIVTGHKSDFVKAQVVGTDSAGGYLVSDIIQNGFIDLARDAAACAAAGVGTIVLPAGESQGKLLRITGSDPAGGWTAERQDFPEDDISLGLIDYRLRKFGVLIEISREFMETPNGAAMIENAVRQALAAEMDRVMLLGSGAGVEPTGILNTSGIGTITGVGDIHYDDFLAAAKSVRNANRNPTGAIYSPGTEYELSVLKEATTEAYLAPPAAFTAMPKFVTKRATDALAFVGQWDMAAWVIGAGGIRLEIGMAETSFKRDSMFLRAIMPMDVVVLDPAAFCAMSGLS